MPLRKIYMNFSKNVQTTPNVAFKEQKMGSNPGANPNPLIGWRKTTQCANRNLNCGRVQEVFKNVNGPDCCLPRNHMVQNRAGGVSGKIDKKYNHNYRQYLRKRCKLAYYDLKNGPAFRPSFNNNPERGSTAPCCTTDCSGNTQGIYRIYRRNNWGFRKEGAVDTSLYTAKMKYLTKNDCAECCTTGTECSEEKLGRRAQYLPKYPQDDPKSYNHAKLTNNNL